jgi:hypothetical protein
MFPIIIIEFDTRPKSRKGIADMFKRTATLLLALVLVTGLTTSCILDPKEGKVDEKKTPVDYKDLTQKDDILYNLELSYNERNVSKYDQLLDAGFTMIFSDADIAEGKTPDQWHRAKEAEVATRILDNSGETDPKLIVERINLNLDWVAGDWTEEPENPAHPGESWYRKVVNYDIVVNFADGWERRGFGLKAAMTIRWDEDREHWRIVLWVDDVTTS